MLGNAAMVPIRDSMHLLSVGKNAGTFGQIPPEMMSTKRVPKESSQQKDSKISAGMWAHMRPERCGGANGSVLTLHLDLVFSHVSRKKWESLLDAFTEALRVVHPGGLRIILQPRDLKVNGPDFQFWA